MDFLELKQAGKKQLTGSFIAIWVAAVALAIIESITIAVFIGILFVGAIEFGKVSNMNKMYNGTEATIENAFSGFKIENILTTFCLAVARYFFIFLWTLLFIIPGIVKSYSYACAMYIKQENPSKGALECITESRNLMYGYKMKMFLLDLSFILWFLLGIITFGLALLYVIPYFNQTKYNFYQQLKKINPSVIDIKIA